MKPTLLFAILLSSTALAQNVYRRDPVFTNFEHPSYLAPSPPKVPMIRSTVPGWVMEGAGYQLRCDGVAETCLAAMIRAFGAGKDSSVQFVHRESAIPWHGVTINFRANLRVGRVANQAQLVVRAEDAEGKELTRAVSRPVRGTTSYDWEAVTLSVPEGAERLSFALELQGTGAMFFRELAIEDAQLLTAAR